MIIKLEDEREDEFYTTTVLMGEKESCLHKAGTLVMDVGEWQLFGAMLLLGAKQMEGRLSIYGLGEVEIRDKNPMIDPTPEERLSSIERGIKELRSMLRAQKKLTEETLKMVQNYLEKLKEIENE